MPVRNIISIAFERWDEKIKNLFINEFVKAYNRTNNTDYHITSESLKDEQDFDFTLENSNGNLLKMQHTFAGADADEYIHPKLANLFVNKLRESTKDVNNISIHIGFKKVLEKKKEALLLAVDVEKIVRKIIKDNGIIKPTEMTTPLFRYRRTDDSSPEVSNNIENYLNSLEVYSNKYQGVSFGYGLVISAMTSEDRADRAICSKENHYSNPEDLILIIHYNEPFYDHFLPFIKEDYSNSRFGGIWIYDAWGDRFILTK
ncbi:MAG: hypothetical protein WC472_00210 [Candidatus Paceibacterota bacterium]